MVGQVVEINSLGATPVLVKAGPCVLMAARAANTGLVDAYLQIFDVAAITDIILGTTVARWWVLTDADAGDISVGDGLPTDGLKFDLGIVVASTSEAINNTAAVQHVRLVLA